MFLCQNSAQGSRLLYLYFFYFTLSASFDTLPSKQEPPEPTCENISLLQIDNSLHQERANITHLYIRQARGKWENMVFATEEQTQSPRGKVHTADLKKLPSSYNASCLWKIFILTGLFLVMRTRMFFPYRTLVIEPNTRIIL